MPPIGVSSLEPASTLKPVGKFSPATLGSDPSGVSKAVDAALDGVWTLDPTLIDEVSGVAGGFILALLAGTITRIAAAENW